MKGGGGWEGEEEEEEEKRSEWGGSRIESRLVRSRRRTNWS